MGIRWVRLKNATLHPVIEWKVQAAKRKYRKIHYKCAITSLEKDPRTGKKVEVHHKVPVHVRPDLACDPDNLESLLPCMHFWAGHLGHLGRGWLDYNKNLPETIRALRAEFNRRAESGKFDPSVDLGPASCDDAMK